MDNYNIDCCFFIEAREERGLPKDIQTFIKNLDALTGAEITYNFRTGLLLTSANEMIPSMKSIVKEMKILRILGENAVVNDNIWK